MKNEILRLGLVLCIITAVAGLVLAGTNSLTAEAIEAVEFAKSSGPEVANAVVPGSATIEGFDEDLVNKVKSLNEDIVDIRECKDANGNLLGYGITSISPEKGFNNDIEIILGISTEGEVVGMEVTSHYESPGLGNKVDDKEFQALYFGKTTDEMFTVSKMASKEYEIQAITSSTITSKSITSAVNNAMSVYNEYLK